ncbi:hypothetical protein L1987_08132 [Smallanthus sonchifolius]|uniref:Uncharacterized protein n=1 Tax=Smallanthus sonchifolius TaxID=185202 RepID=A0ACB9JJD1_9ASTR|nr:hypothetical protein L1987_08132 [Smallanthus sonchifolius]
MGKNGDDDDEMGLDDFSKRSNSGIYARHAGVLEQWFGNGFWDNRKLVMFIVLIVFLAPLCALDKIESLSMTSAASVVLAILFVTITCVVASIMLIEGKTAPPRLVPDNTEGDVLTNFDKPLGIRFSTTLNFIVRVGYIFHLILVFPVIHFSLRQTVDALAFSGAAPLSESKNRCLGLTCAILGIIYMASIMIPSIWTAFKFTGATTAVSLGFTFPALIALRLGRDGPLGLTSRERLLSWLMLVLAIIVSLVGVFGNIYGMQDGSSE